MRVLLAAILLVAIVALTWKNYQRGEAKVEAGQAEVRKEAGKEIANLEAQSDSLTTLLGAQQTAFGDSLIRKDSKYQAVIDSLEQGMQSRDKQISDLKLAVKSKSKSQTTASEQKKTSSATTAATEQAAKRHLEILTYYQNRFKTLPADLSEYERKVAVNEIRQETQQKFAITAVQLDRIRSDNNLTY